jgi:hypothetical protein
MCAFQPIAPQDVKPDVRVPVAANHTKSFQDREE